MLVWNNIPLFIHFNCPVLRCYCYPICRRPGISRYSAGMIINENLLVSYCKSGTSSLLQVVFYTGIIPFSATCLSPHRYSLRRLQYTACLCIIFITRVRSVDHDTLSWFSSAPRHFYLFFSQFHWWFPIQSSIPVQYRTDAATSSTSTITFLAAHYRTVLYLPCPIVRTTDTIQSLYHPQQHAESP